MDFGLQILLQLQFPLLQWQPECMADPAELPLPLDFSLFSPAVEYDWTQLDIIKAFLGENWKAYEDIITKVWGEETPVIESEETGQVQTSKSSSVERSSRRNYGSSYRSYDRPYRDYGRMERQVRDPIVPLRNDRQRPVPTAPEQATAQADEPQDGQGMVGCGPSPRTGPIDAQWVCSKPKTHYARHEWAIDAYLSVATPLRGVVAAAVDLAQAESPAKLAVSRNGLSRRASSEPVYATTPSFTSPLPKPVAPAPAETTGTGPQPPVPPTRGNSSHAVPQQAVAPARAELTSIGPTAAITPAMLSKPLRPVPAREPSSNAPTGFAAVLAEMQERRKQKAAAKSSKPAVAPAIADTTSSVPTGPTACDTADRPSLPKSPVPKLSETDRMGYPAILAEMEQFGKQEAEADSPKPAVAPAIADTTSSVPTGPTACDTADRPPLPKSPVPKLSETDRMGHPAILAEMEAGGQNKATTVRSESPEVPRQQRLSNVSQLKPMARAQEPITGVPSKVPLRTWVERNTLSEEDVSDELAEEVIQLQDVLSKIPEEQLVTAREHLGKTASLESMEALRKRVLLSAFEVRRRNLVRNIVLGVPKTLKEWAAGDNVVPGMMFSAALSNGQGPLYMVPFLHSDNWFGGLAAWLKQLHDAMVKNRVSESDRKGYEVMCAYLSETVGTTGPDVLLRLAEMEVNQELVGKIRAAQVAGLKTASKLYRDHLPLEPDDMLQ